MTDILFKEESYKIIYLIDTDSQQTLNNIKATKFKLGLLINFGTPSLTYKRILN
jgi:pentose-5-phosphate-3-epimerase